MWALVTGGARRIGKAISLRLAKAGYGIAIHAHRGIDDAEALADEIREQGGDARVFSADLTQKVEAETLVVEVLQGCGRLDALILNAANFERVTLSEIDDGHWERALTLNLRSQWWVVKQALSALRQNQGNIVFVTCSSTAVPFKNHLPYVVSKGASRQLMRALAIELAPQVRVNAVAPGTVLPPTDYSEKTVRALTERSPLKKVGGPESVADAVAYLCQADFVTGVELMVDGGRCVAAEPAEL